MGIFLLLNQSCGTMFPSQVDLNPTSRSLRDLTVVVGEGLEGSCKEVVESVRKAVTAASRSLHADLQGKLKLDTVTVQVPETWTEADCGDKFVSASGARPWTVQSQGCAKPGSHVVLPLSSILGKEKDSSSSKSYDNVNIGPKLASNLLRL